jgi:hypothetical protein
MRVRGPLCKVVVWMCVLSAALLLWSASALAAGDASEASCPNEGSPGFHSYLPDCRAYEMVTPPYKQGYPVLQAKLFAEEASGGAPLVTGFSLGVFGGGPSTYFFNNYTFRRTGTGWATQAINPPVSQYIANINFAQGEGAAGAIASDGSALIQLRKLSEPEYGSDLYRVDPAGNASLVGPMLPASAIPSVNEPNLLGSPPQGLYFAGASEDLSRALYYITPGQAPEGTSSNLWPGDTTLANALRSSMYEYVGVGHTGEGTNVPALVAVDAGGHLLGQCGVSLGGPSGDSPGGNTHNAISADGETIFFTVNPGGCSGTDAQGDQQTGFGPPARELYARLGARGTVAISEPSLANCAECDTSSPQDAHFVGASRDGSKVFFLTTQSLLPEDSSGNDLYEYDFDAPAGHRISRVSRGSATAGALGLAATSDDGSRVYFVAEGMLAGQNAAGAQPVAGGDNLYVALRRCANGESGCANPEERTTFIATLESSDEQWAPNGESPMNVTPDGRYLVFTSFADITPDDTTHSEQVFRYDAVSERLIRVSIGEGGYNDDGNAEEAQTRIPRPLFGVESSQRIGADQHPAVSNDGSVVVFSSSLALTPQAVEDPPVVNIYEYRAGHVYLISDGRTTTVTEYANGSKLIGVSTSGRDVLFETFGALLAQDTDEGVDVYDARADGGFSAPAPSPAACEGDACQRPSGSAPATLSPGTVGSPGEASAKAARPAAKSKRLTRAQQLRRALSACARQSHKRLRAKCQQRAQRLYGHPGKRRPLARKPAKKATTTGGVGQ